MKPDDSEPVSLLDAAGVAYMGCGVIVLAVVGALAFLLGRATA